jgi:cyclohexanecarboxylate-CoA ligase
MAPLVPTTTEPLAAHYARPGGPWDETTLDDLLRSPHLDRVAATDGDGSAYTVGEIESRVASLAGGLSRQGVGRGEVVAWTATPGTASVVVYRACWRIGAVAAPLHNRLSNRERDELLSRLAPKAVIDEAQPPSGPSRADGDARPEDVAVVLFTSGSTGRPKGVLHTHRALAYKSRTMVEVHGLDSSDVVLMPAPLAHVSGLLNGVLVPGAASMRSVFMPRWDPDRALDLVERESVTFMVGPPTFFVGLMQAAGYSSERVGHLRLVSSGGAGVTAAFVTEATRALGCVVKRTYGSTEAPTVATSREGDDPARRATADGRSTGDAEFRVVTPEGAPTATGEAGELQVRGPELFAGYLDAGDNVGCLVDGWFRTGDLATLADGWVTITGRLKDVIIRGGENIATAEVEEVLEGHPSVIQAVVVGESDPRLGERVVAVVVTSDAFDLDQCRDWFSSTGVARFKTPERLVVVESLPLLATGKPDRRAVRDLISE